MFKLLLKFLRIVFFREHAKCFRVYPYAVTCVNKNCPDYKKCSNCDDDPVDWMDTKINKINT